MKKNIWVALVAMISLSLAFSSCEKKVKVTKLDVFPAEGLTIGIGDQGTVSAQVQPSNAAVTFSIDNEAVATITSNGKTATVKAVKEGEATVTVTAGDLSKTVKVTVSAAVAVNEALYIGKEDASLEIFPLYLTDMSKDIKGLRDVIKKANEAKGWKEGKILEEPQDKIFQFIHDGVTKNPTFKFAAYLPKDGKTGAALWVRTFFFLEHPFFNNDDGKKMAELLAQIYGFGNGQWHEDPKAGPFFAAEYVGATSRPEGSNLIIQLVEKKSVNPEDKKEYNAINAYIFWEKPEAQQSAPVLEPDFLKILESQNDRIAFEK